MCPKKLLEVKVMQSKSGRRRLLTESLEERRVLAASLGWDGPGQGSVQLSYYIGDAPNGLNQAEVDAAIEIALNAWSSVADVNFVETDQPGLANSLDFTFRPIDGSGGTLAQAYYPSGRRGSSLAGDIQLDATESWEIGNDQGTAAFDLTLVAAHEIGHALGLDHSAAVGSVMYPSVAASQVFTSLSSDDEAAILELYAADDSATNPTADPSGTEDDDRGPRSIRFTRNSWFAAWHASQPDDGFERLDARKSQWHNLFNPLDVNTDNSVTPLDALFIISALNGSRSDDRLCDTNGDGTVSPLDALYVIAGLNRSQPVTLLELDTVDVVPDLELPDVAEPGDSSNSDETLIDESPISEDDSTEDDSAGDIPTDEETTEDETTEDPICDDGTSEHITIGFVGRLDSGSLERLFGHFDSDSNSELTEEEVPEFLWRHLIALGIDENSDGIIALAEVEAAIDEKREQWFTRWDADGDEQLTAVEIPEHLWNRFEAADTDSSGGISLTEWMAYLDASNEEQPHHPRPGIGNRLLLSRLLAPSHVDALFSKLDANSDDVLTNDEVPDRLWEKLIEEGFDENSNGEIATAEVTNVLLAKKQAAFDQLDVDGDELLSEDELPAVWWRRLTNAQADANSDGGVSFEEILAFQNNPLPVMGRPDHLHRSPVEVVERIGETIRNAASLVISARTNLAELGNRLATILGRR